MSKIIYFKDYLSDKSDRDCIVQPEVRNVQLSLFPEPALEISNNYYYVLDIKKESDSSFKEFLAATRPVAICEIREVPNFYSGSLSRSKFFEILNNFKIRYIYADALPNFKTTVICCLVDNDNVSIDWLNSRIIELQNERLSN